MGMGGRGGVRLIARVGGTWDRGPLGRAGTPIIWPLRTDAPRERTSARAHANLTPAYAVADCFVFADGTRVPSRSTPPGSRRFCATAGADDTTAEATVRAAGPASAASLMTMAEQVIASSDPETFWAAWLTFEAETNRQLMAQLDAGIPAAALLTWVRDSLNPAYQRIGDGMAAWRWGGSPDHARRQMDHDVMHRCVDVQEIIPDYIECAEWNKLRALCAPASTSLQTLAQRLKAQFGVRTAIRCVRMNALNVATPELAEAMRTILENCIRNAIAHPAAEGPLVMQIVREANRLLVIDTAAGIAPQALARLRAGERIHNGEPVIDGPHGLGWPSIRATCARFGIAWAIESTVGEGTTVTFTFPPDTFTPALDFSIGNEFHRSKFDLPTLLSTFTNAGKVQAAIQLFDHSEAVYADGCRRMEWAGATVAEWQRVHDWIRAEKAKLREAELILQDGLNAAHRALVIAFSSSYWQPLLVLSAKASDMSESLTCGESGDNIPTHVAGLREKTTLTRTIDAAHGYRVTAARSELAGLFLSPLLRAAATQEWDGPTLTLRYTPNVVPTDPSYIHRHIDWTRPDPDPLLATILGWTITTDPTSTGLVVRIDFGASAV